MYTTKESGGTVCTALFLHVGEILSSDLNNFMSGDLDEFRIEAVQVCLIISAYLNCDTETNFKQIFPVNKRKTIEIHQKFCYADFVNQMSIRRNCDQSSIFSNSN